MDHGPGGGHKIGLADMVALFFSLNHSANEFDQVFIGRTATH